METEEPKKLNYYHVFLNRFAEKDGFKFLNNIIFEQSDSNSMTPNETSPTPIYSNFLLIQRIVRHFELALKEMKKEIRYQYVMELKERVELRVKNISDKEIKEFEIDTLKKIFEKLHALIEMDIASLNTIDLEVTHQVGEDIDPGKKVLNNFVKFMETEELNLYYRFIDSSSFDKKLRGINGIREFITRAETKVYDEKKPNKKPLNYFTEELLVKHLIESKLIETIYVKNNNIELLKKSADVLKFIGENIAKFPIELIDIIWASIRDKREEIITAIYGVIVEIGTSLKLEAAQYMYTKFLEVKYEDYDDDFINLIGKYTEKCLRLVAFKSQDNKIYIQYVPEDLQTHKYFGVPLMFNIMMDDSPLNSRLSQMALDYLLTIIADYPAQSMFSNIREKCIENILNGVSVYQSLLVLKCFFIGNPQEEYLTQFEETHNILDYISDEICIYLDKVREKSHEAIKLLGKAKFEELFKDEPFVGKFGHHMNIYQRYTSLRFYGCHIGLNKQLSVQKIEKLWIAVVLNPVFSFERSYFLSIISEIYTKPGKEPGFLIQNDQTEDFLKGILCNPQLFDINNFTEEKFSCLEIYFKQVNIKLGKIVLTNEIDMTPQTIHFNTADKNLVGLEYIWKYLVECPNPELIEKFTTLLVNIYTKLGEELRMHQQEVYKDLIATIMDSIEQYNHKNELTAIERYINFLGKLFSVFERKRSPNYYRIGQTETNNPIYKVKCTVKFRDYNLTRPFEFSTKDRLGYVKEVLAINFEVDSDEIEMTIDDIPIADDDAFKELKDYTAQGQGTPVIAMAKRNTPTEYMDPKRILVAEKKYLDIFFSIFDNRDPGKKSLVLSQS
jgi:hypothetical protein